MGKGLNKIIGFSIVLSGFCALSSQIVFLREFLIIFYGNELSIGFIFASWLFSVAVGSFAYGLISSKVKGKITLLCCCFTALSLLLPASLIAIQLSKTIMHFAVGEIVPLFPIAVSSFILLFPVCLFFGFIFSLCCELYQLNLKSVSAKISAVYILEAIGSGLAGILVSFFLIRFFDSLEIIIFTAIFNLITALLLVFFSQGAARKLFIILTSSILLLFLFFLNQGVMEKVAHRVQNLQWQGYRVLASKNSIYANLTVAERNKQISFFENGLLLYAVPGNKMQEEESIHFAMLENPNPKEVLLIGGGVGLLDEILKYPVNRVDYLEIDSLIIKLTKKYLPRDLQKSLNDKRVEIKNLDARFFVKSAKEKYDCIIIHTGSPLTAQLNRYYTVDFFRQLKALLKENGVVSFALNSSENYFNKELREFLQSIYFSVKDVFSKLYVIPGDTVYFIAGPQNDYLTYDYKALDKRRQERGIETKYVRQYYLFSKLSPERISYIENIFRKETAGKNYDLKPRGYFYNLIFWTTNFRDSLFSPLLKSVNEAEIWAIFIGFLFITGIISLLRFRCSSFSDEVSFFSVAITGFSAMSLQVVILLTFQIIYGYLFYKLGFILAAFMVGLALGGYLGLRFSFFKESLKSLTAVQFLIFIYTLILPFIFNSLIHTKSQAVNNFGENAVFIIFPAICGILAGAQFSLANKICLKKQEESAKVGGLTYALDLFGSCIAAFITAIFLIPILGIAKTCFLMAGLNLVVWFLLGWSKIKKQSRDLS